jgi:serine/threonine protein kinase
MQAVILGLQLLAALKHLHKRSLLHRDVAARNCYLAGSSQLLRLCDPALSRDLFPNDYHCLGHNENRPVGTGRLLSSLPVLRIRDVLSRIRIFNFFIPDPGGEKAPDLGSRILLYIKMGMKNKTNFFLAFYSFRRKFY